MLETGIAPDFIVVDGTTEGGTGAAPLEFMDHMGMPLRDGLTFVHAALIGANLRDRIKLGASGKITSAFDIARVMALGADWCNAGRHVRCGRQGARRDLAGLARFHRKPSAAGLRTVAVEVAAVARQARAEGLCAPFEDEALPALIAAKMWEPVYRPYRRKA